MPQVAVTYDCDTGTATLTASNYQGELLWSTGEKTESIVVSEEGDYSVLQIFNKQKSKANSVFIPFIKGEMPTLVQAVPSRIVEGGVSRLTAKGCEKGTLRWFADKDLTEELTDIAVQPIKTTTYYVICESEVGCRSQAVPVTVEVEIWNDDKCRKLYKSITISQLVTPNNDGHNDSWDLNDVLEYCKKCNKSVKVELFNRWGAKVYEKDGYMLDEERFRGYSENALDYMGDEKLPSGTYFYLISVDGEKTKTGFINLITEEK